MNRLKKMALVSESGMLIDAYVEREQSTIDYFLQAVKMIPSYKQMDGLVAKNRSEGIYKRALYVDGIEGVDFLKFELEFTGWNETWRNDVTAQFETWKNDGWIIDYEVIQ